MCDVDVYRFDILLMLRKSFAKTGACGIKRQAAIGQQIYEGIYIQLFDNCPDECIRKKVDEFPDENYAKDNADVS